VSDYSDIADAIRVAEERAEAGFVGCVTVRLDTLRLWRAKMMVAAEQESRGAPQCPDCSHALADHQNGFCSKCECGGYLDPSKPQGAHRETPDDDEPIDALNKGLDKSDR